MRLCRHILCKILVWTYKFWFIFYLIRIYSLAIKVLFYFILFLIKHDLTNMDLISVLKGDHIDRISAPFRQINAEVICPNPINKKEKLILPQQALVYLPCSPLASRGPSRHFPLSSYHPHWIFMHLLGCFKQRVSRFDLLCLC